MAKSKILQVINGGEVGGAEEIVLKLIASLNPEKYTSEVICLCKGPFVELLRKNGFDAQLIAMKNKLDFATIPSLQEYMREKNIALVHTHGFRANLVARLAAKREGLPVVTTYHSAVRYDYDNIFKAYIAKVISSWGNKRTDCFIAISAAIKQEIMKMGVAEDKIRLIHNGLDVDCFQAPREPEELKKELGLDENKITITMVARLHPVKGHEFFLRAAREIIEQGINAQFLIIGEGRWREKIEEQVKELGLEEKVFMPGYYSPIEDIYALTDIFCLSSLMEGFGMVILEAMWLRVPVVASRVGGIPEIIDDGYDGFLVEPRDYKALGRALIKLCENKKLTEQLIVNGEKKARMFTVAAMSQQVEKIYANLLEK